MWIRANGEGIGDAVFISSVAYHVKKQTGEFIGIACEHRELYLNNPDVDQTVGWRDAPNSITFPELHDQGNIKEHNVQFMCRKVGIEPPAWEDVRQYIYLTPDEEINDSGYITVHSGTGIWTRNKTWYGFDQLVKLIKDNTKLKVYQIVGPNEQEIKSCDKHLHIPLRQVAAYIKSATRHICGVTGTMHIASGVGTKSIVIYGGRERARITGYYNNVNIESNIRCAPCWLVEPCPYGVWDHKNKLHKPCMEEITPEMVWERISHEKLEYVPHASGRYHLLP